jgi:hypothetical protein
VQKYEVVITAIAESDILSIFQYIYSEIWKLTNKKDLNELLCLQTEVNRISWLHEEINNRSQVYDVCKAKSSSRNRALRG